MPADYQDKTGNTTFAVETHTTYKRELVENAPYIVTAEILAYDDKSIHNFLRMYDSTEGFLAATIEWLGLHIDLAERRVIPWPDEVLQGIRDFAELQGDSVAAREVGHRIRVRKPLFDIYGDET